MSKELTTTNKPLAVKDSDNLPVFERVYRDYGTRGCMEVSKQTMEEIDAIVSASADYYRGMVFGQGVWPDRRIVFRNISIQASQQFDSKAFMQLKNEFRGAFADITTLREQNQAKAQRIMELEDEVARLRGLLS